MVGKENKLLALKMRKEHQEQQNENSRLAHVLKARSEVPSYRRLVSYQDNEASLEGKCLIWKKLVEISIHQAVCS